MRKLIKTTAGVAVLLTVFGAVLFARAAITDAVTGGIAGATGAGIGVVGPLLDAATGGAATAAGVNAGSGIGASFLGWIGLKGLGYALFVFSYIAGLIGSTLFTLASLLVEFGLFLNTTILDSPVVQLGWRFCRDLANLGFTIGIVVIAYATMLGYESYGIKKLLLNFMFAAILVNFSFSIAGFLIDGSNLLTNFFVSASIGGSPAESGTNIHKFATTLASAFGPQRLLITDQSGNLGAYEMLSQNGGILAGVLSVFFIALFTTFAALGMLAVGLTTFWRFANLSGLIIVMPLAILCFAFPQTKSKWNDWWTKFWCHLTYLPIATFSIYLIIMFVQIKASVGLTAGQINANDLLNSFEKSAASGGGVSSTLSLMAKPFQTITDMAIVLTLLVMGILGSSKMGCAAGKIATEGVEGIRDWAAGRGKYKFAEGRGAFGWAGNKFLSGGETPDGNRGTRLGNFMSRIPLVGRLVPNLKNFTAGTSRNIGNFETEYKRLGDVQLLNSMRNPDIRLNAERMAASAKVAAERGLFSEDNPERGLTQKEFESFIGPAKRYGLDKEILKKAPHLYGKFGWDLGKAEDKQKLDDLMRKDFKPEDMENLGIEALNDPEIVSRLSSAHLEKLSKKPEHRRAFSDTIDRLSKSMGSEEFAGFMAKSFSKPEAADVLMPQSFQNPLIVQNLTNAHLKRLSGSDKKAHRDELLATINNTAQFGDREFGDFMRKNFAKGKDIDDIHPDILRNQRFFNGLDEKHIERMNAEPDENQQEAMLSALREWYKDANAGIYTNNEYPAGVVEKMEKIDRMTGIIVNKKKDWQWSPLVDDPKTKDAFFEIETNYRSRHPDDNQQKQRDDWEKKQKNDKDVYGPSMPPKTPPPPPVPPVSPQGPPAGGGGSPVTPPAPTQKATDIQNAMDAALKNTKLWPSQTEIKDEFPQPVPRSPLPSEEAKPNTVVNAEKRANAEWNVNSLRESVNDLTTGNRKDEADMVRYTAEQQLKSAERRLKKILDAEQSTGQPPPQARGTNNPNP